MGLSWVHTHNSLSRVQPLAVKSRMALAQAFAVVITAAADTTAILTVAAPLAASVISRLNGIALLLIGNVGNTSSVLFDDDIFI